MAMAMAMATASVGEASKDCAREMRPRHDNGRGRARAGQARTGQDRTRLAWRRSKGLDEEGSGGRVQQAMAWQHQPLRLSVCTVCTVCPVCPVCSCYLVVVGAGNGGEPRGGCASSAPLRWQQTQTASVVDSR
ncbi:hypothetical protein BS50DRAFT_578754 [Corynespora cassiicola Philippines]|uniref:Uncharacterized protein n=1 Tax=Corynespora cassiicola Philippines TaxID=1448308 RepID=A0A2T2N673_CORCC|nr:hypothetical protein BS50DRAFT_578754 [Corynespora cassiicola Philippines]